MSVYIGQIRGRCVWVYTCWMEVSHKPFCSVPVYIQSIWVLPKRPRVQLYGGVKLAPQRCCLSPRCMWAAGASPQSEKPRSSAFSPRLMRIETQSSSDSQACADKGKAAGYWERKDKGVLLDMSRLHFSPQLTSVWVWLPGKVWRILDKSCFTYISLS